MPPVNRAVSRTTAVRKSSGHATEGTDRNFRFRLSVYCRMEIVRLTAARPIQSSGLPGTKNSRAVLFQAAISQIWCQRNNSGNDQHREHNPTAPRVVKSSGFASM